MTNIKYPISHPISQVVWVDPNLLHSNAYNPNRVFSPEMKLLKLSILAQGWTQPIVVKDDNEIIDGFHRWTLAMKDEEIRKVSGGLCPVVYVAAMTEAEQMAATVRHNRARGAHGILAMGKIVRALIASGKTEEQVAIELGMDSEETARLADMRGSIDVAGKENFGKGWTPQLKEGDMPKSSFSIQHKKDKAQKNKPSRGL